MRCPKLSDTKYQMGEMLGMLCVGLIAGVVLAPIITNPSIELYPEINLTCPEIESCNLKDLDYRLYELELHILSLKNYSFMEEELQEFQFLQMVLNKFAENHEYDTNNYNCQHFARDMDFIYANLGYEMSYDGGYNEGAEAGHMWNEMTISIDSSRNKVGYFNDDYDFKYEPKELTGLKVIRGAE